MVKFIEFECGFFEPMHQKMVRFKQVVNVDRIIYAMPQGDDEYRLLIDGNQSDIAVYSPSYEDLKKLLCVL